MWVVCDLKVDRTVSKKNRLESYPVVDVPNLIDFETYTKRDDAVLSLASCYYPDCAEMNIIHAKRLCKDLLTGSTKIYKIRKLTGNEIIALNLG